MEWDVRLVNGSVPAEGRLEVFFDDQWNPCCLYYGFDSNDVKVVCRELGYSTVNASIEHYGQGSDVVFTLEPWCSGDESRLIDCDSLDSGVRNTACTHVGIKCNLGTYRLIERVLYY